MSLGLLVRDSFPKCTIFHVQNPDSICPRCDGPDKSITQRRLTKNTGKAAIPFVGRRFEVHFHVCLKNVTKYVLRVS